MTDETFADLEHAGWDAKANAYDEGFNRVSSLAFPAILNHLGGDLSGRRTLDVCCGTGELTSALGALGANVTGVDFSEAMVEIATRKFPMLNFVIGDAQNLRFDAASIDDFVCAFGMLHFSDPDQAVAEAARVLKTGGRYIFTVWNSPDQGSDFMDIVMSAIEKHGSPTTDLPPAPPIFRFADADEVSATLGKAGFDNISVEQVDVLWHPNSGQEFLDLIYGSMVRTPMMLNAQKTENRKLIEATIVAAAEKLRDGENLSISIPATLVTATKHD